MLLRVRFEDEAAHAGAKHVHDNLFAVVHRVSEDLDAREFALEGVGQVEAVELGIE